ncbi:MAG TPA: MerR family transcriptional regulator [Acidimicrobiales bacterium]|jgi:DNA-binding transcriptional MerR regulator|nr:MerR family transcriptional regulator [Actinomycetota bacterium]MDP6061869.1 MerR family transcriptional regulator [Acidimicrobiales bacterium]MDP6213466.1 MerR family transcriptional regulator [Acidimicrobiales bacterium]MDP7209681.1 MerR family transcriptional regulator [Acidimicrobiales bacterium]HJL89661.1 MerR family transcriptional regulator [Acidimicrobiales bacterium]|tara:strand:- start:114313 stop:115029 length:717 start_codon:yes stop_codon:yes gene_type:complete
MPVESSQEESRIGIGEVLSRLEAEFPDVTVSKLRYLESQGLISPDRSTSGYRRFSDSDMDRLVWILRQQSQNFLPLKVIRDLLEESGGDPVHGSAEVKPFREQGPAAMSESVSVTLEELATAAAVSVATVRELEKLGLVEGSAAGSTTVYDADALLVTHLARTCADNGLDIRHLRMHLVAAQREAGVLEQILLPRLRNGDPAAVAAVRSRFEELVVAGGQIRDIMRRRSMGRLGRFTH